MLSGAFLIKNLHSVVSLWENVLSAYEYLVMCWTRIHSTSKYISGSFKFGVRYEANAQTQNCRCKIFQLVPSFKVNFSCPRLGAKLMCF
jgi:hypothetical protein